MGGNLGNNGNEKVDMLCIRENRACFKDNKDNNLHIALNKALLGCGSKEEEGHYKCRKDNLCSKCSLLVSEYKEKLSKCSISSNKVTGGNKDCGKALWCKDLYGYTPISVLLVMLSLSDYSLGGLLW